MKTSPFWWEFPSWETRPLSTPNLPTKVDVAIIGAGYTGLNAALVLARAGLKVAVFEAQEFGAGASARNGGMVGPSFHKLGVLGMRRQFGEEVANGILVESIGFVDTLESFLKAENIAADFKRTGRLLGARRQADLERYRQMLGTLQNACNVQGHIVAKQDMHSEIGSDHYVGGLVFPTDGGLNPAKYLAGLAQRVQEAGAVIYPETPVEALSRGSTGHTLTTPRGTVLADEVAICTNGYTGKQFGAFRRRILPVRSAILATKELPTAQMAALMPKQRMHGDSRRLVAYYRPSPDGKRLLFGGRAVGLTERPAANERLLRHMMLEVFPQLKTTKTTHVWSGLVAYSFSHAPHIGKLDGLHFAMGYVGSGVARASYFGTKLGHKILGNEEAGRTSFDQLSFNTKPLYTGNPWFMPSLVRWQSLLDKLKL